MTSNGIRDRVAIVGMGCTPFGERWDKGTDDLLTDAAEEAIASAGVKLDDIDAFWLGTMGSGSSGLTLSKPLKIDYKPVTRVENFCATGSEAFRNACYAVASGAYDLVMAIGVEKLKDSGYSGLTGIHPVGDGTDAALTLAGRLLLPRAGLRPQVRRRPRGDEGGAHPHRLEEPPQRGGQPPGPVPQGGLAETIAASPAGGRPARGLRLQRRERRVGGRHHLPGRGRPPLHRLPALREGRSASSPGRPPVPSTPTTTTPPSRRWSGRPTTPTARPGSPTRGPQLAMAEVHDCFTPTELVLMEDLGFAERGTAWKEVLAGTFDRDGELPVNPDGGLKSFGHPIGASGLADAVRVLAAAAPPGPARAPDRHGDRGRADPRAHPQPGRRARASA